ncbi:MAG: CDP-diacylglycerol--serine O-phosphatidyltransferase [Bacteriovoracales bacterium]|nr:CDP-diacylglycerol--serine O-phosphatidyltransferase [Bacteriovoracales bacterium]
MIKKYRRWTYLLPNTFTALNLACGLASILLTIRGEMYNACLAVALGALFDSVDGRVARMVGSESAFGEQFDSMSDLITFGLAPALLVHHKYLYAYGRLGIALTFLFLLCTALRLARFNVNISKVQSSYFQGLPAPGAAMGLVGFVLFALEFDNPELMKYAIIPYAVLYSTLMISNIPFPTLKGDDSFKEGRYQKYIFLLIIAILVSLFVYGEIVIGVVITIYVFISLGYFLINRGKCRDIFNWGEEPSEDKE